MSRKSVQRFFDNDMRQKKGLKRRSESEKSRHALGHALSGFFLSRKTTIVAGFPDAWTLAANPIWWR